MSYINSLSHNDCGICCPVSLGTGAAQENISMYYGVKRSSGSSGFYLFISRVQTQVFLNGQNTGRDVVATDSVNR